MYHTVPFHHGYRIETNVGSKYISVWRKEESLRWSFLWREELAKKGFRLVDRFIRTREGEPFVKVQEEYVVVQDLLLGEPIRLEEESTIQLGTLMGMLFNTFREIAVPVTEDSQTAHFIDKTELDSYKKEVSIAPKSMFTHLVRMHWRSLEQRMKQAKALSSTKQEGKPIWALPNLQLEQWKRLENSLLGFSTPEQEPVLHVRSIAQFIQEMYLKQRESLELVERFYREFEQVYRPTLEEQYMILAYFIYPASFFSILQKYFRYGFTDEECTELWMNECEIQEKLDQLHLWFARHIDRLREESISI